MVLKAFGHTEVPEENRIYFHKKEDRSDRDAFFLLSEVVGFDPELTEPAIKPITLDQVLKEHELAKQALKKRGNSKAHDDDCQSQQNN
jgi:hypothetical protein